MIPLNQKIVKPYATEFVPDPPRASVCFLSPNHALDNIIFKPVYQVVYSEPPRYSSNSYAGYSEGSYGGGLNVQTLSNSWLSF